MTPTTTHKSGKIRSVASLNVLYRIFTEDRALLYVGATTNPGARLAQHAAYQPWWDEAATIELKHFDTHHELIKAETFAIGWEQPRYNVIYKQEFGHRRPRTKPKRPHGAGSLFQDGRGYWIGQVSFIDSSGKRRYKRVSSRRREEAERKLTLIKAKLSADA